MRIKTMLQTTAVLGLAVVAGLLGVSGTWALWNVSVPASAGTIQSASSQMKLAASSAETVRLNHSVGKLTPDNPVFTSFTVTNETNASGDFRLEAVPQTLEVESDNTELAEHLIVDYASLPNSDTCGAATYEDPESAVVNKDASIKMCVRMSLPETAPSSLSGSAATVTTQVTATQISSTIE